LARIKFVATSMQGTDDCLICLQIYENMCNVPKKCRTKLIARHTLNFNFMKKNNPKRVSKQNNAKIRIIINKHANNDLLFHRIANNLYILVLNLQIDVCEKSYGIPCVVL
jgi:hypothetical protein